MVIFYSAGINVMLQTGSLASHASQILDELELDKINQALCFSSAQIKQKCIEIRNDFGSQNTGKTHYLVIQSITYYTLYSYKSAHFT